MSRPATISVAKHLRGLLGNRRLGRLEDRQLIECFLADRDEAAFAALVQRHGPLVLGVCRRVLHNEHDAEDAFQATFLILARQAQAIRKRASLASWLHGVARRVALRALDRSARRRRHEQHAGSRMPAAPVPLEEMTWRELRLVLDEELARLPDRYRAPLMLCCLEGKTQDEAAAQLNWTKRAVRARLERARGLLRQRLSRRGLSLPAALLTATLSQSSLAAVPATLAATTVASALGQAAAGAASTALAAAVLRHALLTKLTATLFFVAAAIGTGMILFCGSSPPVARAAQSQEPPPVTLPGKKTPQREPVSRPQTVTDAERERLARTQDAIALGLQWLVRQQQPNGNWALPTANDVAATALALLPLLEAGDTHKAHDAFHPYARKVERGLNYLVGVQNADGYCGGGMYAHGLAALALCEAYRRSADPLLKGPAQRALDYIVMAQHDKGGWRYGPKQPGDTSVTAYQVHALTSGQRAGLAVPDETLTRAAAFLDSVASADGSAYAYTSPAAPSPTMSAAGLLCRLEMGAGRNNKGLVTWAENLRQHPAPQNLYYLYYLTRVLQRRGGEDWKAWEPRIRKLLLDRQDLRRDQPQLRGSWPADGDTYGGAGGRLLMTSLALLSLQTCARNDKPLPLLPRELTAAELSIFYRMLGADDILKVRDALRALAAAPRQTVPFLKKTLKPAPAVDVRRIERLIADLDSARFEVREKATAELLENVGDLARAALRKALAADPSLETRRRIERILRVLSEEDATPEQRRSLGAVEVLVQIGTVPARAVLHSLADGASGARLTEAARAALRRLDQRSAE